uniref:Poly(A) RNA polymerase mitochondrial-like central palm domain-containing protein n=3 Tax=Quercus lobata TaxID=97700 RepID=A0A7N2R9U6_QUELO
MSANSTLEHILEEILEVLKPRHEELATRAQVINELRRVVESVPSLRGAAVESYGSFVSNLFTKWGDVDISINLTKGGYISHVEYDRKIKLLGELKKYLIDQWQMVRLIPARVPILKCESSHNIFSCDISIDNLICQIKSKLLLWISEIDGRFRDMVLLVKEWAKAHEINDATSMGGTFNSYSLTLLVIFHFQTCEPAIFPPLKDIYAGNVTDDLQGLRTERNIAEACAANIRRFRQDKSRRVNHSSLSEIFISFLAKFSDKEFEASKLGICTYSGKCESRRRWSDNSDAILIEDPFDQKENSARAVSMSGLTRISEAFEMSRVISEDQNLDSLLATLVRPQVSQEIRARHNQGQHSGDTGTSSVLVGGLLLGGLAAGTLGYMYAPELSKVAGDLRRKFFDDSYDDSDKWCANSTLEPILEEILKVLKPKQEDLATRAQVINELRRVVESVQSLRGAAVEPFGSFVSNLFTKWSDVDISINLSKEGGYISYVESDRKQRLLVDLQNPLSGQWQKVRLIPAKVPILKCESSHKIFSCDISIDNFKGQMKSKLFLWISEIDGRFRDMILLVKEWAKAHDINDPNSGTINSYSLSLLVIFHFQTCEPAIFPPLKDIYAGNVADDLQGLRTVAERNIAEACAANIKRFRKNIFRRVNHSSLSELFISFLAKFSNIGDKASEQGICTKTGEWVCRRSNKRWSLKTDPILIEDPFEQPENSAKAVRISGLTRISEAFENSHRRLSSADQNQDSLLVTLVRSQVSREIRARLSNPVSYSGGYQPHLTRPHVHRNVNLQAETQNKFQNLRLESNSNNPTLTETVNMYGKFEASESKKQNQFQNSRLESRSYNPSMTEIVQAQSQGQHSGDAGKSSLSFGGLLLGGLVAGLGYMYAPEINKAADGLKKFFDNSDDDSE